MGLVRFYVDSELYDFAQGLQTPGDHGNIVSA